MIIEENINKILVIEDKMFNHINMLVSYYDHCVLSLYLHKYFEENSNLELSEKYLYRGRTSLKNYFLNAKFLSLSHTWYGGIGLLYIMRGLNKDGDLNNKIISLEKRINDFILNQKYDYSKKIISSDYDILYGLSGVGIYFLDNNPLKYKELLKIINKRLFQILYFLYDTNSYEKKEIDYSISHGILGILFYLSKYYKVFPEEKLLKKINVYLNDYKSFLSSKNSSFLKKIPIYTVKIDGKISYKYPKRSSWCYGMIGMYRALYLIAKNLNDIYLKNEVIEQVKLFKKSDINDYNLNCPTFCHGYSGIYYFFSIFNNDENQLDFGDLINKLECKIWSFYDDKYIYSFPKYDYDKYGNIHNRQTKTSIVDGIASICIAYLSSNLIMSDDFFARSLALK